MRWVCLTRCGGSSRQFSSSRSRWRRFLSTAAQSWGQVSGIGGPTAPLWRRKPVGFPSFGSGHWELGRHRCLVFNRTSKAPRLVYQHLLILIVGAILYSTIVLSEYWIRQLHTIEGWCSGIRTTFHCILWHQYKCKFNEINVYLHMQLESVLWYLHLLMKRGRIPNPGIGTDTW